MGPSIDPLLQVRGLEVTYGSRTALRGVDFEVRPHGSLAVVGESGSGKSTLARAVLGLLPKNAYVKGTITFNGMEVRGGVKDLRTLWGVGMTAIFQDVRSSMDPLMRVGEQIEEVINVREEIVRPRKGQHHGEVLEILHEFGFRDPESVSKRYPHQLSGGERQRAALAMAYALRPLLLVADEPTSNLDLITQAQIIDLIRKMAEMGTSILFITHDLYLASSLTDRTLVLYAGRVMEEGATGEVLERPLHPFTRELISPSTNPLSPPSGIGCPFSPRCPSAFSKCVEVPPIKSVGGRRVGCHLY